MSKAMIAFLAAVVSVPVSGQYKYGIKPTSLAEYRSSLNKHPEYELIDLADALPSVILDIRYATANNFTGRQVYSLPKAYVRKPVYLALASAQRDFGTLGWSIKVFDAYRPYKATVKFYELYHDTTYVASPYKGSRHNRGCAVDMTVVDSKTGQEMKMPTGYDSFSKEAWPTTAAKDPEAGKNRAKLIEVMEKNGFKVNASEWWHFDFVGWEKFDVLDIDFEELN